MRDKTGMERQIWSNAGIRHIEKLKALCRVKSFARKVTLNQIGDDQDFEIGEFHGVSVPYFGPHGYDAV
jgi:hypothetical protein